MSHNKPTKHITSSTSPSTVTRRVVSEEELVLKSRELVRSKLQLLLSLDATGTPTTLWKDTYRSVLVRVQKSSQKRKPNKVDTYVANTLNQLCKLLDDDTLTQEQFEKET